MCHDCTVHRQRGRQSRRCRPPLHSPTANPQLWLDQLTTMSVDWGGDHYQVTTRNAAHTNTTEDHRHRRRRPLLPSTTNVANARHANDTETTKITPPPILQRHGDHEHANTMNIREKRACDGHPLNERISRRTSTANAATQTTTSNHGREGGHTYGRPHEYSMPPIAQRQRSI